MPSPSSSRFLVITIIILAVAVAAIGVSANWGGGGSQEKGVAARRLTTTPLNAITSFDAAYITAHVDGLPSFPTNEHKCAADATNNGHLTSNDAARVAQYVSSRTADSATGPGTTAAPPCNANWPTTVPVVKGDVTGLEPIYTAGSGSADVSLPTITAPAGTISIPITVSDLTGMDVFSYDFQVTYDPLVLHPAGFDLTCHQAPPGGQETCYSQAGTISSTMLITANATESGHLIISGLLGYYPRAGSGTLLVLNFDIVGSEGQSTALTFEDYTTSSDGRAHQGFLFNEGQASAVITNGSLTVGPGHSTATATPTAMSTATNTATPAGTPGSVPIGVSLPDVSAAETSGITIPITAGNTTALGVIAYDLQVTYDPAVLQPANPPFDKSGTLSSSMNASTYGGFPGHVIVSAFQGSPISGSGTLINLKFTVVGTSGQSTALTFENYMAPGNNLHPGCMLNEGDPASTTTNGSVTVGSSGGAAIAGTARYGNAIGGQATRFVPNVMVDGIGSTGVWTTTDLADGDYSLSGFGSGSYTVSPSKTGGLNAAISSFDAAKIAGYVVGAGVLTGNQLIVADVSDNGSVSSFDAAQIAAYVAGLPGAGTTGNWRFNPASRTYASVSTVTGEDYTALLMGEVSGNWANTGGRPVVNQTSARSGSIGVTAPRLMTSANTEILIPVAIRGAAKKGIISYEFDLRYDPSVIEPQAVAADMAGTVSRSLSVVTNAIEPGLLRVVVYGPMPITSDGVLLNLRFTAVGKPGSVSPLTWERIMFNEGEPRVNTADGQVELF